jgi:hypothetical protein
MAMHPIVFGNMNVGFYSAYYIDVTPMTVVYLNKDKYPSFQYKATH